MASAGRARDRRLAAVGRKTEAALRRRLDWRDYAAAGALIRAALDEAGIDPVGIFCLRIAGEAGQRLAEHGETPARAAAEAAYAAEFMPPRKTVWIEAAERQSRWAEGGSPERGASILDWLAWARVRKALSRNAGEGF